MAGSQAAWGLDVGVTSLKAIKLKRDGDRVSVEAFDVVEHEKFLSEPDVDKDDIIKHSLQKFIDRNPIHGDSISIGVPGSTAFARFVKLPPVEPKKVPEIVRFEAIQQIPFPLDQVNWDYQTFQSPDSPEVEVGIFAMKKELVAQVMQNFRHVGMTVKGVQMSPLAVYNAAEYDGFTDGKGSVLLDMGAEHTDLVILDQGRLWLRTINIGGNHFTDALAKSFKQPFSRAEQLKKTAATSKYQKQIFQAMRPIFADLVAEIQRSIGHYNSSHRDSKLERIVGMGNPFRLPNLQKYLQQELKMEVVRLDTFRRVNSDGRIAAGLNENILGMTCAYGLAIQGLGLATIDTNLLPVEIARAMMWRNKQPWFIAAAALIVLSVGAVGANYWLASNAFASPAQDAQKAANNGKIHSATDLKQRFDAIPKTFDQDKASVEAAVKLADFRSLWPLLTLDIYNSVPQSAAFKAAAATQPDTSPLRQANKDTTIVITGIDSTYYGTLSSVSTDPNAVAAAAGVPTPPPVQNPNDNGENMAPTPPPQAAVAVSPVEGPSDHGFVITITGYARSNNPDIKGEDVPKFMEEALMDRAPIPKDADAFNASDRPYYFSSSNYIGKSIDQPPPPADANTTPTPVEDFWGKNKGSNWDAFVPRLVNKKDAPPPTGITANPEGVAAQTAQPGDLGGPVDPFIQDPNGPHYMYGTFVFTLQFKVHVK